MRTRIAQMVPVEVIQDDMVDFASWLPFPQQDLYGKRLLSEKVIWGEIWIADRSPRGMWWAGYVRDGQLYLDQSARQLFLANRKHSRQVPTLMPVGTYKVWLDAWVRRGDYVYQGDPQFTTDAIEGDGHPWSAPRLPARKYWQDVRIEAPRERGEPCRIRVRSRRFHWIYRVSRILDTLDHLLLAHEKLTSKVAETRNLAQYLGEFLGVLLDSGSNKLHLLTDGARKAEFIGMRRVVDDVKTVCENFINYGVCEGTDRPIPERKHINNVAHLLWHLINEESFAREMAFYDPVLAEEHRVMLARPSAVFNRVPRVFASATPPDRAGRVYVEGVSFAYGREFARTFTLPHFDAKMRKAGKMPVFEKISKPAKTVAYLNSVRRYGISMLNSASVLINKENVRGAKLLSLLAEEEKVWGRITESDSVVKVANEYISEYRSAGQTDLVAQVQKNRDQVILNREKFIKEVLRVDAEIDFLEGAPARARGELKFTADELELIEEKLRKIDKHVLEKRPQKVLDALRKSNPPVVYGVQMFEIFVKWAVAKAAWEEFYESAGQTGNEWRGANTGIKGLDALGTTLQFLGLHRLLRSVWTPMGMELAGKGMCAMADIGSAVVYSYDLFVSTTYGDKLLAEYLPEDAVTAYGFHLIQWAGKWMVAVGSSVSAGAGFAAGSPVALVAKGADMVRASPVVTVLQALGYLAQFIGEFGEEVAGHGAAEHKHFRDVHREMLNAAKRAKNEVAARGWQAEFYSESDQALMIGYMERFEWMSLDQALFRTRLAGGN